MIEHLENMRPVDALCADDLLHVELTDGRIVSVPVWWYPQLQDAMPVERNNIDFMPDSMHWPDIELDISVVSLLLGEKAPGARSPDVSGKRGMETRQ
ncbi:hypothetical protein ASE36_07420 [Rhizobium sp. Root274]|uniref:DUF2442 domain-containing protein n=1 Tax=unclassified Rhizobium TaxID=2613769 RepID=UPI000712AEC5|nr:MULTISPECIES: DUF2442 domain-containing protein [unclassified Rhizobium]KQW32021.1 hypothetical protein ASC71_07430 [Rhizobium sp. Root1240]KRD33558.1 hypothetical protein ASE36_07420 [Rhizobium sp. Root274]